VEELPSVIKKVQQELGSIHVLIHNAIIFDETSVLDMNIATIQLNYNLGCVALISLIQLCLNDLKDNQGCVFVSSGAYAIDKVIQQYGGAQWVVNGSVKAAQHNLVYGFEPILSKDNVRIREVIICGMIKEDDPKYNSKAIAEQYWKLFTNDIKDIHVQY